MPKRSKSSIICNNCGQPWHGLTECKPVPPTAAEETRNERVSAVVEILSPLSHAERDAVLVELLDYRGHWFSRDEVKCAMGAIIRGDK